MVSIFFSSSGGHLNPAVTFALCLLGREPWRKFPLFFFFQTLGAFLGAAIVFGMYFGMYNPRGIIRLIKMLMFDEPRTSYQRKIKIVAVYSVVHLVVYAGRGKGQKLDGPRGPETIFNPHLAAFFY